jgi:hypothetical protein
MGGKAFAGHGDTIRLPTARMEPMARAIADAVGARVVEWPRLKVDHGDIDLVIPQSTVAALGDEELARRAAAAVGVEHLYRRPDVRDPILFVGLRVPEGIYQVDLISAPDDLVDFAVRYLSWGDCGTMIGRMAREMGLAFGQNGLRVPLRVPDGGRENVLASADFDEALTWLGWNPALHRAGFEDERGVADFIGTCRYFDPKVYDPERASSEARRRGRARKGRDEFNAMLTSQPGRFEWPEVKGPNPLQDEFLARAVERFGLADAIAEAQARLEAVAVRPASNFTPALVREITGTDDFDIAFLTSIVMEDFTGGKEFPTWKATASEEDVRNRVAAAWAIYDERLTARQEADARRAERRRHQDAQRDAKLARLAAEA